MLYTHIYSAVGFFVSMITRSTELDDSFLKGFHHAYVHLYIFIFGLY